MTHSEKHALFVAAARYLGDSHEIPRRPGRRVMYRTALHALNEAEYRGDAENALKFRQLVDAIDFWGKRAPVTRAEWANGGALPIWEVEMGLIDPD